ncbi:MAG: LytTR family transcriptional regulator DNA-binding domain-containing protein [Flammeovirgaceae bacterium]|jgi:DNA-binding LytR/AlgR family response regulator|nr:LytTR family transcriptional regulator DNA-binding domain-containing protein [Flammeovirgaceae bacterium]
MNANNHSHKNPYHPDVTLFLIIIPFISAFNYYLTYSNIQLSWFLLLTFTIDTVQGYLAWWGVRSFILYLDRRWPFEKGLLKRILFQLFSTLFIGIFIISILTELVSLIAKGKPAPLNFYTIDLFIISIWFFVINGIYLGLHFYRLYQKSEATRQQENQIKSDGLFVKQGKLDIRLSYDELEGFYVDEDYAVASQLGGKKYYLTQSLDKIEKTLPVAHFYRLNRQYIVHRQIISGFKRADNGKILVMLQKTTNFPTEIPVSRLRAPAFKGWFQPA